MNYRQIKGFSKYETNGKQIKNIKTGNEMNVKTGTNKFQLTDDKGKRKSLTLAQVNDLVILQPLKASAAAKKAPAKKEPAASKKESKKSQILKLYNAGKTAHEISVSTGFKLNTVTITIKVERIQEAHRKGLKPDAIVKETGYTLAAVLRNIPKK